MYNIYIYIYLLYIYIIDVSLWEMEAAPSATLKSSGLAAAHQLRAINSSRLQGGENHHENPGKIWKKHRII